MKQINTLIIGGGVTGLSLASYLDNKDYLILEKDKKVGGYCKTTIRNGFVWDYSGHFFHFKNKDIKDYVVKNVECKLVSINKITNIYYKDKLINFPFQYNIHQLPQDEFIECLYDAYNSNKIDNTTFKSYINSTLGKAISDKFIIPYNEKLYACNLDELQHDSMGRFFPPILSFNELLEKIKNNSKLTSYNDSFIYPVKGSFEFVKSILTRILPDKIKTNTEVVKIDLENKIVYTKNETYHFRNLINTLPFNIFLKLSNQQVSNLSANKVAVFNLGFDKNTDIKSHWIYFPGNEIFYRVGFYNNILSQHRMSLYVEIGMKSEDKVDKDILLNKVLEDLKKCHIIKNQSLIDYEFLVMNPAYVHITKQSNKIYNNWCKQNNINNIYSIGRYGSWTYCSIEDNIIQAKETAEILNG
jgi:protoporphyrinogen oxidase